MTTRERLLGISELNIGQKLIHMKNFQMDEYQSKLKSFIDNFPAKETELKNDFAEKNYLAFSKCFSSIRDMLIHIHADDLANECQKIINGLVTMKREKVEAHMSFLLSLLTMLSIDIQMAVYKDESHEPPMQHTGKAAAEEKSILAVDDKAFFLDTIKRVLHGTGYLLTCVTSGSAALKFLNNHMPNLFILDIEMPEMNGYELAQKIRACGKTAPILFMTGNATKEYVAKAIAVGAADFIVKPINKKQILERICKFI